MDEGSFRFLLECVSAQEKRLEALIPELPGGRGSTYIEFVAAHVAGATAYRKDLAHRYDAANSDDERTVLGNQLLRIDFYLKEMHEAVYRFRSDAGRTDLPVGLIYLIEALMEGLDLAATDRIVHLDDYYMYSVVPLVDKWSALSAALGVVFTDPARPIVFNLPGADPANIFLSPIVAHEVGHAVEWASGLLARCIDKVDVAELNAVVSNASTINADVDANEILNLWFVELLCDALAVALTGPSMLFASLVFLPAPAGGEPSKTHPDPLRRIDLLLKQLAADGWMPLLEAHVPGVLAWARTSATLPSPREAVVVELEKGIEVVAQALADVAKEVVGERLLTPAAYDLVSGPIGEALEAGIPPCEHDGKPFDVWPIVLGTWLFGITQAGGDPASLPKVAGDSQLNGFALKAIEMSTILRTWRAAE